MGQWRSYQKEHIELYIKMKGGELRLLGQAHTPFLLMGSMRRLLPLVLVLFACNAFGESISNVTRFTRRAGFC